MQRPLRRPVDAVGPPLMASAYLLYRMGPAFRVGNRCSRAMVQTVKEIGAI